MKSSATYFKPKQAILLFSVFGALLLSGCGSNSRVLQPLDKTTLGGMQRDYEHIPKPITDIKPSVSRQRAMMAREVGEIFNGVDNYKKNLQRNEYRRYGKNRVRDRKTRTQRKAKESKPIKLYTAKLPPKKQYKDPLESAGE